jgi:glycine/D-amino acid oxidase-like deaminating enzyme
MVRATTLLAAAYSPDDGHCTPECVVLGYARAARRRGVAVVLRGERPRAAQLTGFPGPFRGNLQA